MPFLFHSQHCQSNEGNIIIIIIIITIIIIIIIIINVIVIFLKAPLRHVTEALETVLIRRHKNNTVKRECLRVSIKTGITVRSSGDPMDSLRYVPPPPCGLRV